MDNIHIEGSAKILVPEGKITKRLPAFYNPVMKLNRDITVLLLKSIDKKPKQALDLLAGTGIRGIRLAKEAGIRNIVVNDHSKDAIEYVKKNIELNNLNLTIENKEANQLLMESYGFDYIDIDPFGTPVPFIENSVLKLSRDGILGVTATDTAALAGSSRTACRRKYGAIPLRNEFMHETAIRILIKKIQEIGAQYSKALVPIYSYYSDHYYRVFLQCLKGRKKADYILEKHGFIIYCRKCLWRTATKDIFNAKKCKCGHSPEYAGPLWLGPLWNKSLAKKMYANLSADKKLHDIVSTIKQEPDIVGFYDVHKICKAYKIKDTPKMGTLISDKIKRTHFSDTGIKTNLDVSQLLDLFKP